MAILPKMPYVSMRPPHANAQITGLDEERDSRTSTSSAPPDVGSAQHTTNNNSTPRTSTTAAQITQARLEATQMLENASTVSTFRASQDDGQYPLRETTPSFDDDTASIVTRTTEQLEAEEQVSADEVRRWWCCCAVTVARKPRCRGRGTMR